MTNTWWDKIEIYNSVIQHQNIYELDKVMHIKVLKQAK